MLTALIIENNRDAANDLMHLLEKHASSSVELAGVAHNYASALEMIRERQPDLLFLDVELDKGHTAFELLDHFPGKPFDVIFYTGFDKYRERAFDYSAVHYIIKPPEKNKFMDAVARAVERKKADEALLYREHHSILMQNWQGKNGLPYRMVFSSKDEPHDLVLDINNILYIRQHKDKDSWNKNGDYREIVYRVEFPKAGATLFETYKGTKQVREYAELLLVHKQFFRANQSALINIHYIDKIDRGSSRVLMKNGEPLSISGEGRMRELRELL